MNVTFETFRGTEEGKIVAGTTTRTLGPSEVHIETTHSGLCGTDELYVKAGICLGHEGIGIVCQTGSAVSSVKVGDRVGFGYTHYVCGTCDTCLSGWDQHCENKREYGFHDHDQGSFGSGVVWDESCVVPIPDGYDSVDAAPMMCAGGTIWTVLIDQGICPNDRVGVMGVGGLGHLAIKLASAIGCHVVVFSSSESKREEAIAFGASEYYVVKSGGDTPDCKPVKHLLLCGSSNPDYTGLVPLMSPRSAIYPIVVDMAPTPVVTPLLNMNGIRIQGSLTASRRALRSLMKFCAAWNITPTSMTFPMTAEGIEEAMETLRQGKMRYRGVLVR